MKNKSNHFLSNRNFELNEASDNMIIDFNDNAGGYSGYLGDVLKDSINLENKQYNYYNTIKPPFALPSFLFYHSILNDY